MEPKPDPNLTLDNPSTGAPVRHWGLQLIHVIELETDNKQTTTDVSRASTSSEEFATISKALADFEKRTGSVVRVQRAEVNRLGGMR